VRREGVGCEEVRGGREEGVRREEEGVRREEEGVRREEEGGKRVECFQYISIITIDKIPKHHYYK
jgi:hypothetical protein